MPRQPKGRKPVKCAGKNKSGKQCGRWAQHDSKYCYQCSRKGISKATQFKPGPANPNWTGGAYANTIHKSLYQAYQDGLADPELLSVRPEAALVRARIEYLLSMEGTGESMETWKDLLHAKGQFLIYVKGKTKQDIEKRDYWLKQILDLVDQGNTHSMIWSDIRSQVTLLDKLKSSERKRILEAKAFVSITEAIAMLQTITWTLEKVVGDQVKSADVKKKILGAVADKVEELLCKGELIEG